MTEKEWKWPKMRTCLRRDADHAQPSQQPNSKQRTMFKQDTPFIKKGLISSRLMSVRSRSIRESVRAMSPALSSRVPLFTWRYLSSVRFVSIRNHDKLDSSFAHLIQQKPFRQWKYIILRWQWPKHLLISISKLIMTQTHTHKRSLPSTDRNSTVKQWGKRPTLRLMFPTWPSLPDILQDQAWMR